MVCRGIEIDFVQNFPGSFGRDLRLAGTNGKTVFRTVEGARSHEGVLGTIGTVIVDSTLPWIQLPVFGNGFAGTSCSAGTASIAQMGFDNRGGFQLSIRQHEAPTHHGTKLVCQETAVEAFFTESVPAARAASLIILVINITLILKCLAFEHIFDSAVWGRP